MATAQTVWGIDVGRCALKAIKLRAVGDGKVEVLAHDYIEHEKILSEPDANRQELIAHALEKFLSRNDITKDQVYLSVPGQHTLARFTKLPPVAPKRIPDIVRYEADQQIPFDMDEVIWDYQIFEQEDLPDVEVGIFAMKRELLREHLLHFEQASIEPSGVQSCPLAVYNGAHFDGVLGSETTVILDIGAVNIDLVIATPGSLWTRTIPIGGNSFTEALVKSFKLSFSKAESLKRTAESSKYRRQIFQAMRPIFADIVQELQRSIGFYSSTHRDAHIDSVTGYGNAFKLPGLQKYLQQNLGITVTVPSSHSDAVTMGSAVGGALEEEFPAFAVAFGLAVQGLDLSKVSSNLLPTTIAKQAVWRRKRPAFAASAACLVLAGALIWFRQTTDMSALAAGVGEADRITISEAEAPRILDNGPSPSLSAWGQAASVQKAGQELKRTLGKLTGQGQAEREETQKLIDIQQGKGLVLRILQTVHDSLPPEEEALSKAKNQQEVLEAIKDGRLPPRSKRREVTLQAINMQYEPNLNAFQVEPSLIEVEERINDAKAELPGFSLKIVCRTPHEFGTQFVGDNYLTQLRKNGREPGLGFYFDRVWLIGGTQLSSGGLPPAILPSAGYMLGAAGTRRGTSNDEMALDPLTLEPMNNDLELTVWVDVILEDYPGSEEDAGTVGGE